MFARCAASVIVSVLYASLVRQNATEDMFWGEISLKQKTSVAELALCDRNATEIAKRNIDSKAVFWFHHKSLDLIVGDDVSRQHTNRILVAAKDEGLVHHVLRTLHHACFAVYPWDPSVAVVWLRPSNPLEECDPFDVADQRSSYARIRQLPCMS